MSSPILKALTIRLGAVLSLTVLAGCGTYDTTGGRLIPNGGQPSDPRANPAAQRAELPAGARVRVWSPSLGVTKQVGTLVRFDADSVVLMGNSRMAMPRDSVTRLQVSHGYSSPATAAVSGAAMIGGLGLVFGLAMTSSCSGASYVQICGADDVLLVTAVGAGVGMVAGLVIGSVVSQVAGERWRTVAIRGARAVTVTSRRHGRFALGFSVAF